MNDPAVTHDTPAASTATQSANRLPGAESRPPTRDDRLQLIWAFQREAIRRADALAANLGALSGDLMLLAFQVGESLAGYGAATPNSPEQFRQFNQAADLQLKVLRQLDRLVQVERQFHKTAPPAATEH